ncbi:MAG: hypothetical protein HYY86_03400 [Candidatus Harrisonbacteria bacterium]|nr:hypothetical protein [Candidatus Harrisonbacteria bacterium]
MADFSFKKNSPAKRDDLINFRNLETPAAGFALAFPIFIIYIFQLEKDGPFFADRTAAAVPKFLETVPAFWIFTGQPIKDGIFGWPGIKRIGYQKKFKNPHRHFFAFRAG